LEISENLTSFRLHGKEFEITEIELQQEKKSVPIEYEFKDYGFLKIISKDELIAGKYKLLFRFNGQYDKKGQGIIKYTKDSLNYIYTHMEPIHARRFFPCFDEPNFKFTYQPVLMNPILNLPTNWKLPHQMIIWFLPIHRKKKRRFKMTAKQYYLRKQNRCLVICSLLRSALMKQCPSPDYQSPAGLFSIRQKYSNLLRTILTALIPMKNWILLA
jgi:hypothetical protein